MIRYLHVYEYLGLYTLNGHLYQWTSQTQTRLNRTHGLPARIFNMDIHGQTKP